MASPPLGPPEPPYTMRLNVWYSVSVAAKPYGQSAPETSESLWPVRLWDHLSPHILWRSWPICKREKISNIQVFFVIYAIILKSDIFTKSFTFAGSLSTCGRFRLQLKRLNCCTIPWKVYSFAIMDDIGTHYYFNVTFFNVLISMIHITVADLNDETLLQKNSRLFINNTLKDMTHFRSEIRKSLVSRQIRSVVKK